MDGMLGAIKAKRNGSGLMNEEPQAKPSADQSAGMGQLIDSLSDEQKQALLKMLVQDVLPADTKKIEMGDGMGSGEKMEIEMESEGMEDDPYGDYKQESEDEIAESMISSSDMAKADTTAKPRNLGERMRMNLASKLKKKGK